MKKYLSNIPSEILNSEPTIIKAIPEYKVNVPLIVGLSVAGALVLVGVGVLVFVKVRKKKKSK